VAGWPDHADFGDGAARRRGGVPGPAWRRSVRAKLRKSGRSSRGDRPARLRTAFRTIHNDRSACI
jgi:hypothetical protein